MQKQLMIWSKSKATFCSNYIPEVDPVHSVCKITVFKFLQVAFDVQGEIHAFLM